MADCDKARWESRKRLLEPAALLSMGHTLCIDSGNLVCPGCFHGLAYAVPIPQKGFHLHSPAREPAGRKMSADDLHIKEGLVEGEDAACLVCLHMAHEDIVERFRKSGSRDMDEYLLFMFETLRTHKQELLCLHRAGAAHLLLDELKEAFGGERAAKAKARVSNTRLPTMWEASMQTS